MQKLFYDELKRKIKKEIYKSYYSTLYLLDNDEVLKIFQPSYLEAGSYYDLDMEKKVIDKEKYESGISKNIVVPTGIVYSNNGEFMGYTMPYIYGKDYNQIEEDITKEDRENFNTFNPFFHDLEKIIKESKEVVIPDLCTCENIFIEPNGNVKLLDYDGMQIGDNMTLTSSTSIYPLPYYFNQKKYCENGLLTKQLDIQSIYFLYFLTTFNVDLLKVGRTDPFSGRVISLEDIFRIINLKDPELMHKVWKIFQKNEVNEYLGDTIDKLEENYRMKVEGTIEKNKEKYYFKRLYRK